MRQFGWRNFLLDWRADVTALGMLMLFSILIRTPLYQDAWNATLITLLVDPLALVVALLLRQVFNRLRLDIQLNIKSISIIVMICLASGMAHAAWARLVIQTGGWQVPNWTMGQSWVLPVSYYVFIFLSWSLAYLWKAAQVTAGDARQRAAIAEAEALKAELLHLRQQLDPHLLFNALNGIAAEIPVHPNAALAMISELADYLRYSLAHRDLSVHPLETEIDAVQAYMAVQQARFGPDLSCVFTMDQSVSGMLTPSFLLQPLVENAVKHALKTEARPLRLAVEARADSQGVLITVSHPGTLDQHWRTIGNPGVGLNVLRRRLDLLYPNRHTFELLQKGKEVAAVLYLEGSPCFA